MSGRLLSFEWMRTYLLAPRDVDPAKPAKAKPWRIDAGSLGRRAEHMLLQIAIIWWQAFAIRSSEDKAINGNLLKRA